MASVVPVCNPIGHCQRCFGRGFEHSYCCIPPDPTICSPLPESILEILGHFLDRHTGTRSGPGRDDVGQLGGGHASPRIHTRGQHPHQHRTTSGQCSPHHTASVLRSPVVAGDPPSPPARKFCKQVGRRPHFCRGDRAPMGGVSRGPDTIRVLSRECRFRDSQ